MGHLVTSGCRVTGRRRQAFKALSDVFAEELSLFKEVMTRLTEGALKIGAKRRDRTANPRAMIKC